MKAKLIKKGDGYNLVIEQPQGRLLEATCSPSQQLILDKSGASTKHKLSKQNCDEIFGSYNPESMMKDILSNCSKTKEGYILGFKMAMALNKDKVFTLEDMKKAIDKAKQGSVKETHNGYGIPTEPRFVLDHLSYDEIIQSLNQPTEIDVVIVTEDSIGIGDKYIPEPKPLFDSEGCLILKKI